MFPRRALSAAAAALALLAQPGAALAQARVPTIRLDDGKVHPYMPFVRFWEVADEKAAGDTPNERAPGRIMKTPGVYVHGKVSKTDAGIVERKLRVVLDALLAQTPLRDIHGSDLRTAINISRDISGQVQGSLSIGAYPINLANPATLVIDGRYATPGEAPFLTVWYNAPLHDQSRRRVRIVGEYDGIKIQRILAGYAGLIVQSTRPLLVPGANGDAFNPAFFDATRPVGDLQLLWFFASSGVGDREVPTTGSARIAAAAHMADWREIVRRIEQVR